MIPVPIPLWNISVWNAVIFEKIVSEDLQNRRGLFRLGLIEISPIWMCTKSLLKTEWFFTIFSWLGWRIELKLSQVCYFMYILNHLKYEHHLQLCCQLNQSWIIPLKYASQISCSHGNNQQGHMDLPLLFVLCRNAKLIHYCIRMSKWDISLDVKPFTVLSYTHDWTRLYNV